MCATASRPPGPTPRPREADLPATRTRVTVVAEVARNYFELRGAQARLAVARQNAAAQRETLRLTQVRFEVGDGDPVDVDSAKARLSATEATIPELVAEEKRAPLAAGGADWASVRARWTPSLWP